MFSTPNRFSNPINASSMEELIRKLGGTAPIPAVPIPAVPTSTVPVSFVPVSSFPVSSIPVSSVSIPSVSIASAPSIARNSKPVASSIASMHGNSQPVALIPDVSNQSGSTPYNQMGIQFIEAFRRRYGYNPSMPINPTQDASTIDDRFEDAVEIANQSLVSQKQNKLSDDEKIEANDEDDSPRAASSAASVSAASSAASVSELQPGEITIIEFNNSGEFVKSKLTTFDKKKIRFPLWNTGLTMITKDLRSINPREEKIPVGITVNNTYLVFKNNKWVNASQYRFNSI